MFMIKQKTATLWLKISAVLSTLLFNANVAFADAAVDPFQKTSTDAANLTSKIQTWSVIIIVLVLVATAVAYGLGGKQVKKWIRGYWWGILIAVVAIFGAGQFLAWYMQYLNLK